MTRAVAVLVNARAGGVARHPGLAERLLRAAAGLGAVTRSEAELARALPSLLARAPRAWVVVGGDGTLRATVSALHALEPRSDRWPSLLLAQGGTVCTIARDVGPIAPPLETLRRALAGRAGREIAHATLRVDTEDELPGSLAEVAAPARTRVGFIVGTGLVARFFEAYQAAGEPGLGWAARTAAVTFASALGVGGSAARLLAPLPCAMEVDGVPQPGSAWSLVLVSTVRDVGLGFRVTYRAGEASDRVHVVASSLPPRELGRQALRVLAARPLRGHDAVDRLAASVALDFGLAPGPWVLDGDLVRARRVVVRPGPAVRLRVLGD
ncbi:MAG: hypothetical protein IT376_08930 [Polyangiaceae bacterium]|nr:hypothetical protein [Polyangiaceae bacterium]